MVFDGSRLSFSSLLELFWAGHDPTRAAPGSQYRSALFCQDDEQWRAVQESATRQGEKLGRPIRTEILRDAEIYSAEGYHQKWYLRRHPQVFEQLGNHYTSESDLLDSTAATRLNGFLGGAGSRERLSKDIDRLGLSTQNRSYVEKSVGRWG